MNMKRVAIIIVITAISLLSLSASAQQTYKTGLGLRGGYPSGITAKHFLNNTSAVEGVLSFGWGGFGITGLYQLHNPIPDLPGFNWYYGGGAHLATAKENEGNPWTGNPEGKIFLGVDGVIGAEYVFNEAPISIGLDVLPILNIVSELDIWFNAGLSIRYTFK